MTMAPSPDDAHVAFEQVRMAFGERVVFRALTCSLPRGKINVILGGSGTGKSTILRLIGGLVRPQSGSIKVAGEEITRLSEGEMYGVREKLGMMFQGGALLDSLTVLDNVALPLREHTNLGQKEILREARATLASVGLQDVDDLLPGQLSGGMVKRAALARAIVRRPVILLCDEPFSGLDPVSVKRIEALLTHINKQLRVTQIIVSHHIASTMRMADWVVLLIGEEVIEGAPAELKRSVDPRVRAFLDEQADEPSDRVAGAAGAPV
jgi:phospholipid/cholesterol/gamma-HCH transport system ATP-binding protein